MGLPLRSPVAKLSCEAATEENAKRRSFMPRTQVTGKANFSPGITSVIRECLQSVPFAIVILEHQRIIDIDPGAPFNCCTEHKFKSVFRFFYLP